MSTRVLIIVLVMLSVLVVGCQRDPVAEPEIPAASALAPAGVDAELLAGAIARVSSWEFDPEVELPAQLATLGDKSSRFCGLLDFEREVLTEDVVHYSFRLQVGPEPYGVIGLHRVVKESRPHHPIRSRNALFMLHGGGLGFVNSFMASTQIDDMPLENNLPIYFAQNDVDVWGIDMAWTFIPSDEEDFSFAIDWGLQREIDDLQAGIAVARFVRLFTGNGLRKLDLLGWSMGEGKGYAYLNAESQRPPGHRHIKGFIPVDYALRTGTPEGDEAACNGYQAVAEARATGTYMNADGALANFVAYLANIDPGGDSPIFPGFTNMQVVLGALTQTNLLLGGYPPTFHLVAGQFDEAAMPVGYQFVDFQFGVDFYASWEPYQPNLIFQELAGMGCDDHDVAFDDHFDDITVPILYVAPGGGAGALGEYMATQVGSTDFQSLIISTNAEPLLDIGHVDIFSGYIGLDLPGLVWQPILDWLLE